MPISIDYDKKENVIYSRAEGVINLDDISSYMESVAALDLEPRYRILADYSDAILDELSCKDIQKVANKRSAMTDQNNEIKFAVYGSKDLVFGLGRMYGALVDRPNYQTMVFRTEEEARDWLGL